MAWRQAFSGTIALHNLFFLSGTLFFFYENLPAA